MLFERRTVLRGMILGLFFPASVAVARPKRLPVESVDLKTENHYVTVWDGKGSKVLSSSPGFDPHKRRTAASHIKLLAAIVALDEMKSHPALNTHAHRQLLDAALVQSKNPKAKQLAIAITGSEEKFVTLMMAKAKTLGLSKGFVAANASGLPDAIPGQRHDSWATADDINRIALHLARNNTVEMKGVVGRITRAAPPTHSLYYPLSYRHPKPVPVFMFGKTATDKNQGGSLVAVAMMGGKTYVFQHEHEAGDPRSPSATMAQIMLQVFKDKGVKEDSANAEFFQHLREVTTNFAKPTGRVAPAKQPVKKAASKPVAKPAAAKAVEREVPVEPPRPLFPNAPKAKAAKGLPKL